MMTPMKTDSALSLPASTNGRFVHCNRLTEGALICLEEDLDTAN